MAIASIDFGRKRIGLAISDGRAAYPVGTIERRSLKLDLDEIRAQLLARDVSLIVVGLPLSMDATEGPSARAARTFAEHLRAAMGVAVEMFDERLTSFEASERLAESSASRKATKASRDAVAAAIILEGWLESRRLSESVR
ncbi:MAG TPA: Holliday junction resolvase RuvX [Candidatus Binataceae bacterium]|nr:Holliday junction resolvase RuvX [Candidatus Binataceae bacterium]